MTPTQIIWEITRLWEEATGLRAAGKDIFI